MMKREYTQEYFYRTVERYVLFSIKEDEIAFKQASESFRFLSKIPHVEALAHLLGDDFPLLDMQKDIVNAYEIGLGLESRFDEILDDCVKVVKKYKGQEAFEIVNQDEEINTITHQEPVTNEIEEEAKESFLLLRELFIDENSFNSFFNELINFNAQNIGNYEIIFNCIVALVEEYQQKELFRGTLIDVLLGVKLNLYFTSLTNEEIENIDINEIPIMRISEYKNFLSEDIYNTFVMDYTMVLKNVAKSLHLAKEALYPILKDFYSIQHKYNLLIIQDIDKKHQDTNSPQTIEEKVKTEIKKVFADGFCHLCRYSIYTIDFAKNTKHECFKFLVHYETFKIIRNGKFKNQNSKIAIQAIMDYMEGLSKPKPPIIDYDELMKKRQAEQGNKLNVLVENIKRELPKIEWCGTTRQLYDLFLALSQKYWIKEINIELIEQYFENAEDIGKYKDITKSSTFKNIKPNPNPKDEDKKVDNKIIWLGTQVELAELFVELERKSWIRAKEVKLIKNYFTPSDSLHQYLAPCYDKQTKEPAYDNIYKTRYKAKFDEITQNQ